MYHCIFLFKTNIVTYLGLKKTPENCGSNLLETKFGSRMLVLSIIGFALNKLLGKVALLDILQKHNMYCMLLRKKISVIF